MPLIATENFRFSNLVKAELWPEKGYCRTVAVANETSAKTYAVGTVLGKVTATGKYKVAVQTASDGSQTPAALVLSDYSVAANTDTKVLTLTRGPAGISKGALVLDASYNDATKIATAHAAIESLGIMVLETV